MTQCAESLISRVFPDMQVYKNPRFGTYSYKGHVVTLPHNVQNILPRTFEEIPIVLFTVKGKDD